MPRREARAGKIAIGGAPEGVKAARNPGKGVRAPDFERPWAGKGRSSAGFAALPRGLSRPTADSSPLRRQKKGRADNLMVKQR